MNKRGVSPLIATVLILGFVVIIAVFVINFIQDIVGNQTNQVDCEREANHKCSAVDESYLNPIDDGGSLNLTISNVYGFNITYTIVISDLSDQILLTNITTLAPDQIKFLSFAVPYQSKIGYLMSIRETFKETTCTVVCKEGEVIPQ